MLVAGYAKAITDTSSDKRVSGKPFFDDLGGLYSGEALVETLELVMELLVLEAK